MTPFEELCKTLYVGKNTVAEEIVCDLVNELIFDESRTYTDEEIFEIVKERFETMEKNARFWSGDYDDFN